MPETKVMEAVPPPMDAISAILYRHKKRGGKYYQLGESSLITPLKAAQFLRQETAASYFYLSSISYRCCSRWQDAGASLIRCAEVHIKAKLNSEAAVLYSEAGDVLMKVDKEEGKLAWKKAVAIFCDIGRFDIAGRLERRMANQEFSFGHWEDAAAHYRKCANFLAGEQMIDQSDACLEKAAECFINLHELEKAAEMYQMVAEGAVVTNLRRFHCASKFFVSILCLIAIPLVLNEIELEPVVDWRGDPREREKEELEDDTSKAKLVEWNRATQEKYDAIVEKIENFKKIDFLWISSKERNFLRNIIKFRLAYDRHNLADHLYHYNNIRPFDRIQLRLLRVIVDEVQTELDRRTEEYRTAEIRKEKIRIKKEKAEKQKKIMKEMGIKGFAVVDEQEVEEQALHEQAIKDALKAHEEEGIEIHGLGDNDDPALMEEEAEDDGGVEDEGAVEASPPKERRRRKKKAPTS